MKPLNVVVIGTGMYSCGRGTKGYGTIMPAVLEWARRGNLQEVVVVGTDPKGAAEAKNKIDSLQRLMGMRCAVRYLPDRKKDRRAYQNALKSLNKPACVIVAIPDALHFKIAADTISNGFHVLVVKPLSSTLREVRKLIELQRTKGTYCAVEFHKRFDEANLMVRDSIADGRIGDPLYFLIEYSQRKSVPTRHFIKWADSTNVFQYLGVHYVDIIYFATGAKPIRVLAIGQKGWLRDKGLDIHDSICCTIEWEMRNGKHFTSHILTNWIDPESTSAMSDQKIKVIGTNGRLESDQKSRGVEIITDDKGIEEPNPYFCSAYGPKRNIQYRGYGIDSICKFLDDVVDIEAGRISVRELEETRPTFRASLVPTAVLEAVNKSLRLEGDWVRIKDI